MLVEKAKNYYANHNYNCGEAILLAANDVYQLGLSQEDTKLVAGFGGGMGVGGTCGALAGSLAVIGKKYIEKKSKETAGFRERCGDLSVKFKNAFDSTECSVIKGEYHTEEARCLNAIEKAAKVLQDFIEEIDGGWNQEEEVRVSLEEITRLKAFGFLHNKGTNNFNARIITKNGTVTSEEMDCIQQAAKLYASGRVALTTRLTIEVIGVRYEAAEDFRNYIAKAGLKTGGTGSKVRPVVSCKGTTCQYGLIDTYDLALKLHERFFEGYHEVKLPHKFKIAVGGCPNNCVKPSLNDLGIVGQKIPNFDSNLCHGCKKCGIVNNCPIKTAQVKDGKLDMTPDCNHCGRCIGKCPFHAVTEGAYGYKVFIGGRWGKKVAHGKPLEKIFSSEEEVMSIVEKAILLFREQGQTGERFADTIERIGFENVQSQLLGDELLERKDEIIGAQVHMVGGATC